MSGRSIVVVQILTILMNLLDVGANAKLQLCEVESGQTNIILDMEESRGDCKYCSLLWV